MICMNLANALGNSGNKKANSKIISPYHDSSIAK